MRNSLSIFLKYQIKYLFYLLFLFVFPLALLFQFSPYPVSKIQYVFLAALFVSQLYFFEPKVFQRKIKNDVFKFLEKELKKVPSAKEINSRLILIENHRNICIGCTAVCIVVLMLIFQEF